MPGKKRWVCLEWRGGCAWNGEVGVSGIERVCVSGVGRLVCLRSHCMDVVYLLCVICRFSNICNRQQSNSIGL